MFDAFVRGFAAMIEDVRRNVVETGWFGKPVTGRTNTITIGSVGEKSPTDMPEWWDKFFGADGTPIREHDRDLTPKGPDRGIDL